MPMTGTTSVFEQMNDMIELVLTMVTLASVFEQTLRCWGQKQRGQLNDYSSNPGSRWCLNQESECGNGKIPSVF